MFNVFNDDNKTRRIKQKIKLYPIQIYFIHFIIINIIYRSFTLQFLLSFSTLKLTVHIRESDISVNTNVLRSQDKQPKSNIFNGL